MTSKLAAIVLALTCAMTISEAGAQTPAATPTPASGDTLPDAIAISCTRLSPTDEDLFIYNDCAYRINVGACVSRNARPAFLCRSDGSEDIAAKQFRIQARSNVVTNFATDATVYMMACKDPAKPILVNATSGRCVQP